MLTNNNEKRFFISSTYDELFAECQLIRKLLLEAGHKPTGYVFSGIFEDSKLINNFFENCDYGILLIGDTYDRFASIRKNANKNGIIILGDLDIEYAKLIESNCKILPFVKKSSIYTTDKKVNLDNFKRKVFNSVSVQFWENEDELTQKFLNTINYLSIAGSEDNVTLYQNKICIPEPPQLISDIRIVNNLIQTIYKTPEDIYKLTSRQFEELIAELFTRQGYSVQLTKETRDGGKDLMILENNIFGSFLIYGECKKYSKDTHVGVKLVRELYGTVIADKATAGVMITSSYFSSEAKSYTEKIKHQMSLIDYNILKFWLEKLK